MADAWSPVDPDGLLEYSVVYTERSLNHMSARFKRVLNEVSGLLKGAYNAASVVVVPGSGTFGMEAVARQFATNRKCLVIRNGWFSYRWTQIFDAGGIPAQVTVLCARSKADDAQAPFAPAPVEEVTETIRREAPELVFAPHVETSAGIVLPEDYLKRVAEAVHETGGLFVLDCISSGAHWVDMDACGVDILISAPQKGWSASPCCGLVMLGARARDAIEATTSSSFALDLRKWLEIMEIYEAGGQAYHATMPTDGLVRLREMILQTREFGFAKARARQDELGAGVLALLEDHGFASVAAEGFKAAPVIVSYTDDPEIRSGKKFADAGVQIATGVPLRCDEGEHFSTFRIGLFGLDKLADVEGCIERLREALARMN
jgi:aspartate aminotransferase-like enzyme